MDKVETNVHDILDEMVASDCLEESLDEEEFLPFEKTDKTEFVALVLERVCEHGTAGETRKTLFPNAPFLLAVCPKDMTVRTIVFLKKTYFEDINRENMLDCFVPGNSKIHVPVSVMEGLQLFGTLLRNTVTRLGKDSPNLSSFESALSQTAKKKRSSGAPESVVGFRLVNSRTLVNMIEDLSFAFNDMVPLGEFASLHPNFVQTLFCCIDEKCEDSRVTERLNKEFDCLADLCRTVVSLEDLARSQLSEPMQSDQQDDKKQKQDDS